MSTATSAQATDSRRPAPTKAINRAEAEQQAGQLIQSVLCMNLRHTLEATAPAAWEAGTVLLESDQSDSQRLGTLVLLHVLATTKSTVCEAAQRILAEVYSAS